MSREDWHGMERSDGMRLAQLLSGDYIVVPPDKDPRSLVMFCPCCGDVIRDAQAARNVADSVYPPAKGSQ